MPRIAFVILAVCAHASAQPWTFLVKNCRGCHNAANSSGNLNLESYATADSLEKNRDGWEAILHRVQAGEMPPKGVPRPPVADVRAVTGWIEKEFQRLDAAVKPTPGRVTARRLNRTEYNNTIRDLLGVDFRPADDFPQDDSGYGFDNIADALSMPPVLMEKYLRAAEKVVQTALFGPELFKPTVTRHQPPYREGSDGGDNARFLDALPFTITKYDLTGLSLPSALHTTHRFPADGEYIFRIDPEGNRPRPSEPFPVAVWIDGKQLASVDFEASDNPTAMEGLDQEVRAKVPAGEHWVAVSALKLYEGLPEKYGGLNPTAKPPLPVKEPPFFKPPPDATPEKLKEIEEFRKAFIARQNRPPRITDVNFRVNFVEIMGPFEQRRGASPESRAKIFACGHLDGGHNAACERKIVSAFARRAYRRPAKPAEVDRLVTLVAQSRQRGVPFEQAVGVAMKAMLVSPHFLFRIESDPAPGPRGDPEHRINQHELASRLSYFLWSSTPDEELLRHAERGTLRQPAVLARQVRRMLDDPKIKALVENFGGQWLQFRALESVKPDPVRFMAFDDYLRLSMRRETELFFESIIREDRSVLDFLDARYSFLNDKLAQFYGIPGVNGAEFRKVDLAGTNRGGVLSHGSVLTVSSYATRTSVVLRGKWILENLLNAPVPPPPAAVPALDEKAVGSAMSQRQQMEQHRANAICASCHSRMDPLGFGLENFDAIGRWRTQDGKFPIDASGTLPDGKTFNGPAELKTYLTGKRETFAAALSEKMLIYALGRGLERSDKQVVKTIARNLGDDGYKFSSLVMEIVSSLPFQNRKGDRGPDVH
jgi:hypothetical protein